jgi:hypothetical protein
MAARRQQGCAPGGYHHERGESRIEILSPKILESIRRKLGVADGVLDILVAERCL